MRTSTSWAPSLVLGLAALCTIGIDTQRQMPLETQLETVIPEYIRGYLGRDLTLSEDELEITGVTSYVARTYSAAVDSMQVQSFSLYVAYYDAQMRGKTIHSPKNCLPGTGWDVLSSDKVPIMKSRHPMVVNRYLLQKDNQRVLVLYWYQGRGRVRASEYLVKWDLLRDAALHRRTEEALVRVVVPIANSTEQSFDLATEIAAILLPAVDTALPPWTQS